MTTPIRVRDLPLAPNVCDQELREVWRNNHASMAHVIMLPGASSLPHHHMHMTEVYVFESGSGTITLNEEDVKVGGDGMLVEILPGTVHSLRNTGALPLVHYVLCTPPFNPQDVILEANQELTSPTDEDCSADPEYTGARFCYDCRRVIYVGSKLVKDAYYIGSDNFYHHRVCPTEDI